MKKIYQKPEMEVYIMKAQAKLLAGSGENDLDYDPLNDVLPGFAE